MASATSKALCLCSKCAEKQETSFYTSIDVSTDPELKEKVISGEVFLWECPRCGSRNVSSFPLIYKDPSEGLLVCLTQAPISSEGEVPGFPTARQVGSIGELIEKIKIFDAGLDDIAIELCKFITAQDMGKKMDLKFLKMEGADHELTFTYPDAGEMQLLEIGFANYQNCLAILSRNPDITEKAKGLSRIDQAWISKLVG